MKKIEKSDYRVVVYPKGPYWMNRGAEKIAAAQKSDCEAMVEQIKRHVDEVGSVMVECDTKVCCSFCGTEWTQDGDSNWCCDDDINAAKAKGE